ncbi:hypothetical protein N1851_022286 [Merluccius polli]|uniref:Uncharacterized protein n=1 Tax=Merluccius polli TaxID=89951 RepID=A0AA47MIL5_MERPO|nr:hypothetical protein N1851_022286 [Merluccius polli]
MEKPPLAPKPKLVQPQRAGIPPHPRRNVLPHPSPGTHKKLKPALAPKPIVPKLTNAVQLRPCSPTGQTTLSTNTGAPRTIGLLNSSNGVQQENKKPDWDYIIPICLCSQQNCQCVGNNAMDMGRQAETKGQKPVARAGLRQGNTTDANKNKMVNASPQPAAASAQLSSSVRDSSAGIKPTESLNKNPSKDGRGSAVVTNGRPLPHRTQTNKATNGNCVLLADAGPRPPQPPKPGRGEPLPVPAQRKPRKAAHLTCQEMMAEEPEERAATGGREARVKEVTGSAERKSGPSLSVAAPVPGQSKSVSGAQEQLCPPGRSGCPPPAPPPKKKPFLSTPAPCPLPQDVDEEELDWGDVIYEMEFSVDQEEEEEGEGSREFGESDHTGHSRLSPSESQPVPSGGSNSSAAMEGGGGSRPEPAQSAKVAPKKPQRYSAPMDLTRTWGSSEDVEEGKRSADQRKRDLSHSDDSLNGRAAARQLPLPPAAGNPGPSFPSSPAALAPSKASRGSSSASKQRAKSFTAVDLVRSEGQKRHSFRRLLDLKLKMLPRLITKGGQQGLRESEQSVDEDPGQVQVRERCGFRALESFPAHVTAEQSVDGDEFHLGAGDDGVYENIPYYEEISDYVNIQVGGGTSPARAP